MKEIICLDKECEWNYHNHCKSPTDEIVIFNGCTMKRIKKDYKERINKSLEETKR